MRSEYITPSSSCKENSLWCFFLKSMVGEWNFIQTWYGRNPEWISITIKIRSVMCVFIYLICKLWILCYYGWLLLSGYLHMYNLYSSYVWYMCSVELVPINQPAWTSLNTYRSILCDMRAGERRSLLKHTLLEPQWADVFDDLTTMKWLRLTPYKRGQVDFMYVCI